MRYIFVFLIFFSSPCFKNISPNKFNNLIEKNKNTVIIDVRSLEEYKVERIPNAYLASDSKMLKSICNEFAKNNIVLVYCEYGDRSETAAKIICSQYHFRNVYSLKGGILRWKKQGFPIDDSEIMNIK